MTTTIRPTFFTAEWLARFSTEKYDRLVESGILTPDDNLELLENYIVRKNAECAVHDGTSLRIRKRLTRVLLAGWDIREQGTLATADSRPEPDFAIVRGDSRTYLSRHPVAADVGLVVEVANSSLLRDQRDKARIYARAGVVCYWIVNLEDRRVEVHTLPSGPGDAPAYASVVNFVPGDAVPLELGGAVVATIPISELMP